MKAQPKFQAQEKVTILAPETFQRLFPGLPLNGVVKESSFSKNMVGGDGFVYLVDFGVRQLSLGEEALTKQADEPVNG